MYRPHRLCHERSVFVKSSTQQVHTPALSFYVHVFFKYSFICKHNLTGLAYMYILYNSWACFGGASPSHVLSITFGPRFLCEHVYGRFFLFYVEEIYGKFLHFIIFILPVCGPIISFHELLLLFFLSSRFVLQKCAQQPTADQTTTRTGLYNECCGGGSVWVNFIVFLLPLCNKKLFPFYCLPSSSRFIK